MSEWIIHQKNKETSPKNGISGTISGILSRRGVEEDKIEDFLSLRPRTAHDPFLLPDMKEAVDVILRAAERGAKVCVYGDYDADGVTSTALLIQIFAKIFDKPLYYVPSRFVDGYGLNMNSVEKVAALGTDLLVTVDCGSTSFEEIVYAKKLGMQVIVTDHHTPGETEPDCLFVNPKRECSEYPFKALSGCGVAFKLAQAIQRTLSARGDERITRGLLNSQLDLVAISTVADVVPLLDENRSLVKYGLDFINQRRRPGLKTLLSALDYEDKPVDSDRIAYMLAPNINALGRMGSAVLGVELFSGFKSDGAPSDDPMKLALTMKEMNRERKAEQEKACAICMEALEKGDCGEYFPVILAEGAHEGVAGIVAGNIKESLYRPVCIVTPAEGGVLKGTGRSIPGINIYQLLSSVSELFIRYGGHAGACGLTMMPDSLEKLRQSLQEQVKRLEEENPGLLTEKLYIEKELSGSEKTLDFAGELSLLEPYGEANPRPVFCIRNAGVCGLRRMGQEGQHLRFSAVCEGEPAVDCVLFRRADEFYDMLSRSSRVSVAGTLSINDYGDTCRLQLMVRDIKEE